MPKRSDIKKILVIGSGPIVIGQACEFDYSGTQACKVLQAEGYRIVLVNSNPATIMTDPELADRTYIAPLTPEYLEAIISKAMGGRVAEEMIFGHAKVTSGASSDIQMATKLAKDMVTKFGMSKDLGPLSFGANEDEVFLGRQITRQEHMSEETAKKVDSEVKKIVDAGYERAKKILAEKLEDLHKLAKALLMYETLSGEEIKDLILKDIQPKKSTNEDDKDKEESSALGSLGLKPKPAT